VPRACTFYYHIDKDILREFARIVLGGHFQEVELSASTLGKQLAEMRRTSWSGTNGRFVFAICTRALVDFAEGSPKKIIRPDYRDHFPLPTEDELTAPPQE
jgi:hypothetical protein